MTTGRAQITMALSGYHHTDDLVNGTVRVPGVELTVLVLPVEEIFYRFTRFREWHVSEMSFAKFIAMRSRGDDSLVGLPVFPSRVFRHSSIYVRSDGPTAGAELAGARIGLPEWAQTAAVYTRALLAEEFGVPPSDVKWYQAGVTGPGRVEKVDLDLPAGVSITRVEGRGLEELLLDGELDAIMTAHAPPAFERGDARIRRLFADPESLEREWAERTGVFPIMHLMVLRRDVYDAYPWLAANLVSAFEEAKANSLARLTEATASRIPVPWLPQALARSSASLFNGRHWPYGVEPNRVTLDYFCRAAAEQGVAARRLRPEELFAEQTLGRFTI